jgi:hypothetical protein
MFHALPAPPELESLTPFLYIPGDLVDHDEPLLLSLLEELLQQAHYTVIIGGGWGQMPWKRRRQWHHRLISQDLGENIRITGHLSYAEHLFYMTQAQATQLMTLKSSCLMTALLRFLQDYLVGSSVDSFLPHRVPKDFPEQWISRVRQSMSTLRIVPNPDHHLFDQAGNQIQRIYQKILSRSVHG